MWRRRELVGALLLASGSLAGCSVGDYRFLYRQTVRVQVGSKIISASSVREYRWHEGNPAWASMDTSHSLMGVVSGHRGGRGGLRVK